MLRPLAAALAPVLSRFAVTHRQVPTWCSSIRLPAGSLRKICCDSGPTTPTVMKYSAPRRSSSRFASWMSGTASATCGDAGSLSGELRLAVHAHEMDLCRAADVHPVAGDGRDVRPPLIWRQAEDLAVEGQRLVSLGLGRPHADAMVMQLEHLDGHVALLCVLGHGDDTSSRARADRRVGTAYHTCRGPEKRIFRRGSPPGWLAEGVVLPVGGIAGVEVGRSSRLRRWWPSVKSARVI